MPNGRCLLINYLINYCGFYLSLSNLSTHLLKYLRWALLIHSIQPYPLLDHLSTRVNIGHYHTKHGSNYYSAVLARSLAISLLSLKPGGFELITYSLRNPVFKIYVILSVLNSLFHLFVSLLNLVHVDGEILFQWLLCAGSNLTMAVTLQILINLLIQLLDKYIYCYTAPTSATDLVDGLAI